MNQQLIFFLNQSQQYIRTGNLHSAELLLKQALRMAPKNPDVLRLIGVAEAHKENYEEALSYLKKASQYDPKNGLIYSNLGNIYERLRNYQEALDAHEKAISLAPDYAEAYSNMGNVLFELKRYDDALVVHQKAILLDPHYAGAYSNMGNVLFELKRYDDASVFYERALSIKPDFDYMMGRFEHAKMCAINWDQLENTVSLISEKIKLDKRVTHPFALIAMTDAPELHLQAARIWSLDKHPPNYCLPPIEKKLHNKIRIGYFSADFHNHATSYLMAEFFELHDKNQFELIAFSFGPQSNDESRQRVLGAFDQFIDVSEITDEGVALLSREIGIDIAVDLKGYTQYARTGIFSFRAAPIQINYLGYPGTMGSPYIDYIVADQILIPESHQVYYAEKIVYLPNSYQANDSKRNISNKAFSKAEFGLPNEGFIFCCFNNGYKITPSIFDSWSRILKKVEGSILWVIEDNLVAKDNLIKEALLRGISQNRLVFAKRMELSEHLARHRFADLFIDTSPCNAHTTASDALWTGLPVLTLMGESFAGRVAASLLNAIGLPELIAQTQEEYESLAIELATQPEKLKRIREKLEKNLMTFPLFNPKLFTKHVEAAYTQMYERYQVDLAPDHIYIKN